MRRIAKVWWALSTIAAVSSAAAAGRIGQWSDKGYSLHFTGPASEAVKALAAVAGIGGQAAVSPIASASPDNNKQVTISVDGARLYDLCERVGEAIGHPLRLSTSAFRPLVVLTDQWAPDKRPRARTKNYDITLDSISVSRQTALNLNARTGAIKKGSHLSVNLSLGIYPASPAASASFLAVDRHLTLVRPDGQVSPRITCSSFVGFHSALLGRGVRPVGALVEAKDFPSPGEYTLSGIIWRLREPPKPLAVFRVPQDAGKTVTAGGLKIEFRKWNPDLHEALFTYVAPRRPPQPNPRLPVLMGGPWLSTWDFEPYDADGNRIQPTMTEGTNDRITLRFAPTRLPATVVVWKSRPASPDEAVQETFELKFVVPPELLAVD